MDFIAVEGFERLKNGAGPRAQGTGHRVLYFIVSLFQCFNGLMD